MTKKFYVIEPFATSYEYIYLLDNIRKNRGIDLEINVIMIRSREFYNTNYPLESAPYDNLYFLNENNFTISADGILIAGCDAALRFISDTVGDTGVRCNKAEYLSKLSYPARIDDFHLKFPETTISDSLAWAENRLPVIIKPVNGTGSRDVFAIHSLTEMHEMLRYLMDKNNTTEFLVQRKVYGTEYQLDITSLNGEMGVVAIWSAYRGQHGYSWLENYNDLPQQIRDSIQDIISQLKLAYKVYGLYHVETIFDGQNLKVIEINFRNHGHMPFECYKNGTGWAHTEAEIISHLWPNFWKTTFSEKIIPRKKFTARCWIKNYVTRYIEFDSKSLISSIDTVVKISGRPDLYGKIVNPSEGFFSTHIASVMLQSDDEQVLREDINRLYKWADERYG
jgi:hypothetical protein